MGGLEVGAIFAASLVLHEGRCVCPDRRRSKRPGVIPLPPRMRTRQ